MESIGTTNLELNCFILLTWQNSDAAVAAQANTEASSTPSETKAPADEGSEAAGNPITPVPNADKNCDASPPKAKSGNKTIKRKLKVVDTNTDDDKQPNKKSKLSNAIKTV